MSTRNKSDERKESVGNGLRKSALKSKSKSQATASNRNLQQSAEISIISRISTGKKFSEGLENLQTGSDLNYVIKFPPASTSTSTAPVKENWGWSGESGTVKAVHYYFTKETFSMAVKIFRFGSFVKVVPFQLEFKNGKSLRVRPFEKKWQRALWHLVSWIIFAMTAFQSISFGLLWQRADFGQEMAFHIMYLMASVWFTLYYLPFYQNPRKCIVLMNHHDEIMRNSSRLGLTGKHWASHLLVILPVYYVAWACLLFDFIFVLFYLRHPERSQYIYSAFPSSWKEDNLILYGGCALFEFFWMGCGFLLINLCFCYWCAHIYTLNECLNQLRGRENVDETGIESYLFLQLFCVSLNDVHSSLFCPGLCCLLFVTPVLFTYMSLTTYHMLSLIVYLCAPVFTVICIGLILLFWPQNAGVKIKSMDALEQFSHRPIGGAKRSCSNLVGISHLPQTQRGKYMRKRFKAFRRLVVEISFFGAFTLNMSAIALDQIINNVLLLLSL